LGIISQKKLFATEFAFHHFAFTYRCPSIYAQQVVSASVTFAMNELPQTSICELRLKVFSYAQALFQVIVLTLGYGTALHDVDSAPGA